MIDWNRGGIDRDKVKVGDFINGIGEVLGVADGGLYMGHTVHGLVHPDGRAWFEPWAQLKS